MHLTLIPVVGIKNNAEEEMKQKQINQRHQKLREKPKSGKITESHTNPLFVREIRGEKKRILTTAIYNGTNNGINY